MYPNVQFAFVKWNKNAESTQRNFDPLVSYFIIPYNKKYTSKLPLKGLFYITVKGIVQTL